MGMMWEIPSGALVMCGRFSLHVTGADVASHFGLDVIPDLPEHYNIAPTPPIATVRLVEDRRELVPLRWG
jgi:putative SOS response-associated peptidase YedK